ncbi:MAG: Uma2 family endonuclease [Pirellula sp.]
MSTAEQRDYYSVESFLEFLDKSEFPFEYVDGYLRAMSAPTVRHNMVASNALITFGAKLKGSKCRAFNSDSMVRIRRGASTWLYFPDASIICESNGQSERFQDQPTVVVEVLSPSTRAIDLDEKVNNYLAIDSLQMYLILEQHEPHAILFRRTPAGFLRESIQGIDRSVPFAFLGFNVSLAELYDGVDFTIGVVREEELVYSQSTIP